MESPVQSTREVLAQLAREYGRKLGELDEAVKNSQPDQLLHQIKTLAELSTDRFRSAQFALLDMLTSQNGSSGEDAVKAATALCSCFDELHILFQALLDRSTTEVTGERTDQAPE
jgi:hypothetical protein